MSDDVDVKTAIQNGDASALRSCLALDHSRANALIRWGNNDCVRTHPLHYVSDNRNAATGERPKRISP
jgi:hypothetical protein